METTNVEKDQLRLMINKLIEGDTRWFSQQEIRVGDKGSYWQLNYLPGGRNEFNRLVRGLIVRKPEPNFSGDPLQLISSFPFIRFFNQGEKEAEYVNLSNADMLEKLDGTMVHVSFPYADPESPEWHTRSMTSAHKPDLKNKITSFYGKEYEFLPLIGKYVKSIKFSDDDVYFTYIFEFIHSASQVVTKYKPEHYGLYLIGGRNVMTHRELSEDELDLVAKRLGISRPQRWDSVASHAEISNMLRELSKKVEDPEGFVFRDRETGKRIKIKDAEYLKKHRLLSNLSYKNLVPLILQGESEEIVAYFPHAKEKINRFKKVFDDYKKNALETIKYWQAKQFDRKELALQMMPQTKNAFLRSLIFKLYDINDEELLASQVDSALQEIALGKGKNTGSPKRLLEILGLSDDEDPLATNEI